MRVAIRYTFIALSILGVAGQAAWPADRIDQFNRARRTALPLLRSREPADRVEGLKQLGHIPIAETVKLVQLSLGDQAPEVRAAAYQTLVKLSDNQEVCDTLLQLSHKAIQRKDGGQAAPLLAALLCSDLPSVQRATNEFLEKASSSASGALVAVALADELGSSNDPSGVAPLVRLSKTKVFADHFGVRRAIVQALRLIPHKDAVGALIGMLDQVKGEAGADAIEHLAHVTDQIFGTEAAAWQRWWEESKNTFEYPKRKSRAAYRGTAIGPLSNYYGLPLFAERVVFVLDTSGSMSGLRIMAAKRELTRAISGLPEAARFGIVVFNGTVSLWHRDLVPADPESKRRAIVYVNGQQPRSSTASFDALEAALGFDTEAIYFLSDGAPHGGKITSPEAIVTTITAINQARRVSIYTIGIGAGFPGSPLDLFLKTLAEQNLGLYRRVDG